MSHSLGAVSQRQTPASALVPSPDIRVLDSVSKRSSLTHTIHSLLRDEFHFRAMKQTDWRRWDQFTAALVENAAAPICSTAVFLNHPLSRQRLMPHIQVFINAGRTTE
jgi:hypothetical protein